MVDKPYDDYVPSGDDGIILTAHRLHELDPTLTVEEVLPVLKALINAGISMRGEAYPPGWADNDRAGVIQASLDQLIEVMNSELSTAGITTEFNVRMENGKYVLRDVKFLKQLEPQPGAPKRSHYVLVGEPGTADWYAEASRHILWPLPRAAVGSSAQELATGPEAGALDPAPGATGNGAKPQN